MRLSAEQISRQIQKLPQAEDSAVVFGFAASLPWEGPTSVQAGERTMPLFYCRSVLEIAERVSAADGSIVLLTPVPERDVPRDVLARMVKQQLLRIDRTALICDGYGVKSLDPRIPRSDAMMDALLHAVPSSDARTMSPVLSLDGAWRSVLRHYLGLDAASLSLEALLVWSAQSDSDAPLADAPEDLYDLLIDYLRTCFGEVAKPIVNAFAAGHARLLLPIGLTAELLEVANDAGEREVQLQAAARLEDYLGDAELTPETAATWSRSALVALKDLDAEGADEAIAAAEGLIDTLKAGALAHHSSVLPAGYAARKRRFGESLDAWLQGRVNAAELEDSLVAVRRHCLATDDKNAAVTGRMEMAVRLVHFLTADRPSEPASLSEACSQHARQFGFVDWARRLLVGGDPDTVLASALDTLCERVFERREAFNRLFAEKLADALELDSFHGGVLPIERFVGYVGKLAGDQPVLLLVLDGLDWSAFEELAEDMRAHGWSRWQHSEFDTLLSAVPSVTEMSRKALLTGDLSPGPAAVERKQFEALSILRGGASNAQGPLLFHKAALEDSATEGVASAVRDAISETKRRVVGVVLNAVDDHLAKTDQLRLRWTIGQFRHLKTLLDVARHAGRTVIVTSDHGHVLEASSQTVATGRKGRWRQESQDKLVAQEIRVTGRRVEASTGQPAVVALWSERARYGKKATGYHGGVAPQEVVVPYAAFTAGLVDVPDWQPFPEPRPAWWRGQPATPPQPERPPVGRKPAKRVDDPNLPLFDEAGATPDWITTLLNSPALEQQRALAGRAAPDTAVIERSLRALVARQQRISMRVLAQELKQPELRMRGLLAGLQRVLNVEGYSVIASEDQTRTITLDVELLKQQFDIRA